MLNLKIEKSWQKLISKEFQKDYFKSLASFLEQEYARKQVFPPANEIFEAFNSCPFPDLKVVILGQDPYHGLGQAHGLCFSVNDEVKFPPSLKNIFKELKRDLGVEPPEGGNLTRWAKQGCFLLNTTMTVREGEAGSHQKIGWEEFTDAVIRIISEKKTGVVFVLWGAHAQKKLDLIDICKHHVICSAHPSPLSACRGFFGSAPFSQVNEILKKEGEFSIKW